MTSFNDVLEGIVNLAVGALVAMKVMDDYKVANTTNPKKFQPQEGDYMVDSIRKGYMRFLIEPPKLPELPADTEQEERNKALEKIRTWADWIELARTSGLTDDEISKIIEEGIAARSEQ